MKKNINLKNKTINYLLLLFFFALLFFSCDITDTKTRQEYINRDYIWREDTLDVSNGNVLTFRNIVGSDINNLWVGTLDASSPNVCLWHYNGVNWKAVPFFSTKPWVRPTALLWIGKNSLWAGTPKGYIRKMETQPNGEPGKWIKTYYLELNGYSFVRVYGMCAKNENCIYAVGWAENNSLNTSRAIILHYDGLEWSFVETPKIEINTVFHEIIYEETTDRYYIFATNNENGFLDKIFMFDGKTTREIISTHAEANLSKVNGIVYINSKQKVYKYIDSTLTLWKDFTGTEFESNFVGRNEIDLVNNSHEGIGHYNGNDYKTIYKTSLLLQSKIIFENDVFVLSNDKNNNYIIIHGKLKR